MGAAALSPGGAVAKPAQGAAAGVGLPAVSGFVPSGVSTLTFPLTADELSAHPDLTLTLPLQALDNSSLAVRRGPGVARPRGGVHPEVSGGSNDSCSINSVNGSSSVNGDSPQEIVDLAASLKNNWQLIYAYVYNDIDIEPTAESTKGPLGTYLDQSGNSFDQASLLVALLRAAGYTANWVVGKTTLTAAQLGLPSLPQQLITDAGGSSDGTTPYAWVQLYINGNWITLDPANKTFAIVPAGSNLSQHISSSPPSQYNPSTIDSNLNGINYAYAGFAYGSLASFIGGRHIIHNDNPPTNVRTGGTVFTSLTVAYRTGLAFYPANAPSSAIYFCTDQFYGHTMSVSGTALYIDGLQVQTGLADPVKITLWHPNPGGSGGWGQQTYETLTNMNAVISVAAGQVSPFRAKHDGDILNALSSTGPTAGTLPALLAVGSGELSQTAQEVSLLDQLAGTYVVNHHTLQIVRANNTIDTPITMTSVDQVTSTPASGLSVLPISVSYALSAAQSAQEAVALGQGGASQPVSAVSLLGSLSSSAGVQYIPPNGTIPAGYTPLQNNILSSYMSQGYGLVIPTTAPSASSPMGFVAMNGTGTSAFVLSDANGVIYKGAADLNPVTALGTAGEAGHAAESGPSGPGLNVDPGTGEVTFAEPLISVGSAAPYKLEFDLLYSSSPGAQVTASTQTPTARPESPGFANNLEMRATASSDGFPMVSSGLAGLALPGVSVAYNLLVNADALARCYAGQGGSASNSAYAEAVIGNWMLAAGTNNVVTVTRGLSSSNFYKLPWAGYVTAQPSGDQLTQSGGTFNLRTAHGDKLAFNTDGQIGTITSPAGPVTSFFYSRVNAGPNNVAVNILGTVYSGTHSLSLGYAKLGNTSTYLLTNVRDETGRQAQLNYGNCYGSVQPATPVPQLCAGTKPDWNSSNTNWPVIFNFAQPKAGTAGAAVLLTGVNTLYSAAQTGYVNTTIAYDGARLMPTGVTNANGHTTSYAIAPDRSEVDDALGNASVSKSFPLYASSDTLVTDSTDALGNKTELTYNYVGQLLTKTLPDTQSGYQYTYTYDALGNLASTAVGPTANSQQIVTSTVWDQTWNKPHVVTDALGNVTTYNWNSSTGTLTSIVHPAVTYQGSSVQPTEGFTYASNGQLQTATAADGEVTCYTYSQNVYDLVGVKVDCGNSPHLNLSTSLGYDTVGNLTSVQTPRGNTTTMTYDLARRVLTTLTPAIAADGGAKHTTTYTYNLLGQLTQTSQDAASGSSPPQLVSSKTYDPVGNVLTQTVPTTGSTQHTTTTTYNADERVSTTTTPISSSANQTKTQTYDADSRLFQVFLNGNLTETHLYNGDGLPSQIADGAATLNAAGVPTSTAHTTSYAYDAYDRLTTTTYSDGTTEVLTLDNGSRVTKRVTRNGSQITYVYDAMGRVTSETDQGTSTPITTTYDLADRPLTVAYAAGSFTYAYDTAGRQSRTVWPSGVAVGYAYDADSNTAAITYPDSWIYSYLYDELDRMTRVQESAPGATSPTTLVTYGYDVLSRRIANTFGNGTSTAYSYDDFSGVSTLSHSFVGAAPANGVSITYTRDYLERRINDSVSVSTYVWHPSATATTTYQANALNQYTAIGGQTLGYGTGGNLHTDPTAPLGSATYAFNLKNQMVTATNAQHTTNYGYDPFNRRTSKNVDGVATNFILDGDREIADYAPSGQELTRFVYGADAVPIVEEPISGGQPSDTWYHHLDALGTTLAITNHTGALLHAYSASPWGELGNGTPGTPFRFAGMRLDPETMLHYDHARYYSPQQGRFISPDPIGVKGGVNIYAYAENDPLNGIDISGLNTFATYNEGATTSSTPGDPQDQLGSSPDPSKEGGLGPDSAENWSCSGNCGGFNAQINATLGYTPGLSVASLERFTPTMTLPAYDPSQNTAPAPTPAAGGNEGQPTSVEAPSGVDAPTGPVENITVTASPHIQLVSSVTPLPFSGTATYYAVGKTRADGGKFDPNCMCAATYGKGLNARDHTTVTVTTDDGSSVDVTVNDSGPFLRGPDGRPVVPFQADPNIVIDLTPYAFEALVGDLGPGHVHVTVTPR